VGFGWAVISAIRASVWLLIVAICSMSVGIGRGGQGSGGRGNDEARSPKSQDVAQISDFGFRISSFGFPSSFLILRSV
jgi:hypothetical protein